VARADIVVAAAGVPGVITGEMVKPGAAVLDVGVSRVGGKVTGDAAPDVWDVAAWVSPNPRGVGPMTRAMLMTNVVSIEEHKLHRGVYSGSLMRLRNGAEPQPRSVMADRLG